MNIWSAREKSLIWFESELRQENKVSQEGFDYLKLFIEHFQKISDDEGESQVGQFSKIYSITLAKFSRFLFGIYSLTIDGLAQEGGALLRPLIETYELLVYFRLDKSRIYQVFRDELPSAGTIGKRISGDFKNLRNHLNSNASHFGYKKDSVQHLFSQNGKITPIPLHSLTVLRTNLSVVNSFLVFVLFEATTCLFSIGVDANSLADEIEKWRDKSVKIFPLKK